MSRRYTLVNNTRQTVILRVTLASGTRHNLAVAPFKPTYFEGSIEESELRKLNTSQPIVSLPPPSSSVGRDELEKRFIDNRELLLSLLGWQVGSEQLPPSLGVRLQVLGGTEAERLSLDPPQLPRELYVDETDPDNPVLRVGPDGIAVSGGGSVDSDTVLESKYILENLANRVLSAIGEVLVENIRTIRSISVSSSGAAWFAHYSTTNFTATIKTSTGYARPILADGSLGTQVGSGVAATSISLNFASGGTTGAIKAVGFISVTNGGGSVSGTITSITISGNSIVYADVAWLSGLTALSLTSTRITKLRLMGTGAMTTLTATGNFIDTIEWQTGAVASLVTCNLAFNPLLAWPSSVTSYPALTTLDLRGTKLRTFSGTGLSAVVTLNLSGSSSSARVPFHTLLPTGLSSCETLEMAWCDVSALSLTGLAALKTLNIQGNPLKDVDLDPVKATLENYYISNTDIAEGTTLEFDTFPNLKQVDAQNCAYTGLRLKDLPLIETVNANYNTQLVTLDFEGVDDLHSLSLFSTGVAIIPPILGLYSLTVAYSPITSVDLADYPALGNLYLEYCDDLVSVDNLTEPASFNILRITNSPNLVIPGGALDFSGMSSIYAITLSHLDSLQSVNLGGIAIYGVSITDCSLTSVLGATAIETVPKGIISFANNALAAAALDSLYTQLKTATAATTLVVSGNPGTDSDTPSIAQTKGYIVSG